MSIKGLLRPFYRASRLVGYDPGELRHLRHLRRYFREARTFRKQGGVIARYYPVLRDYQDSSGAASGHYFHQDLLVSQFIHERNPRNHLDVGSRIDGFVAHVASFRTIDVLDIRPLSIQAHPNIRFVQADLLKPVPELIGSYESVSCLHALEHFGLGRYTDPIIHDGHLKGFAAVSAMVAEGGLLYVSVPVGRPRVEFNAHRIFSPEEPIGWAEPDFAFLRFDLVDDAGELHKDANLSDGADLEYGCGIYTFRRIVPPPPASAASVETAEQR